MKIEVIEEPTASCKRCHQLLRLVQENGREVARDYPSGEKHVCWDLPEDANLLVMEEDD